MKREEVEVCPHCEQEITKRWDVEKNGFEITCPNCKQKIMLCGACMGYGDNLVLRCDWAKEKGCFRKRKGGQLIWNK